VYVVVTRGAENDGHKNDGSNGRIFAGHEIVGHENAEHEIAGQKYMYRLVDTYIHCLAVSHRRETTYIV